MIINKLYIEDNYSYITNSYIDLVNTSINYISNTGFTNNNIKEDLVSLNHYVVIINEFAKYYASLMDNVTILTQPYLAAYDESSELNYLQSSDLLYLATLDSVSYSEVGDNIRIVDRYMRLSVSLVSDIEINTNISTSGVKLKYINNVDTQIILQDQSIDNSSLIDYDKASSFVDAVRNANNIIFKYLNTRYTNRIEYTPSIEYKISFIVKDMIGNVLEGAEIAIFGDDSIYTNSLGIASINKRRGTFSYTASYGENKPIIGSVKVIDDDTIVSIVIISDWILLNGLWNYDNAWIDTGLWNSPYYTYSLTVVDSLSNPIENAIVIINDTSLSSDVNGLVEINLLEATYSYTVSKVGFLDYSNYITILNSDATNSIMMSTKLYTASFVIIDDYGTPVKGAVLTLSNGNVSTTGDTGIINLTLSPGIYSYTVTSDGRTNTNGLINMTNTDIVENIQLDLIWILIDNTWNNTNYWIDNSVW